MPRSPPPPLPPPPLLPPLPRGVNRSDEAPSPLPPPLSLFTLLSTASRLPGDSATK